MTTAKKIETQLTEILEDQFGVSPRAASDDQFYRALALYLKGVLAEKHRMFHVHSVSRGRKGSTT